MLNLPAHYNTIKHTYHIRFEYFHKCLRSLTSVDVIDTFHYRPCTSWLMTPLPAGCRARTAEGSPRSYFQIEINKGTPVLLSTLFLTHYKWIFHAAHELYFAPDIPWAWGWATLWGWQNLSCLLTKYFYRFSFIRIIFFSKPGSDFIVGKINTKYHYYDKYLTKIEVLLEDFSANFVKNHEQLTCNPLQLQINQTR